MVIIMNWYFRVDENKCTGCGACAYACKFFGEDILYMGENYPYPIDDEVPYLCMDCDGHCFEVCKTDAIEIGKE